MNALDQLAIVCFSVAALMFVVNTIESTSAATEPHRWLIPAGLAFVAIGLALQVG